MKKLLATMMATVTAMVAVADTSWEDAFIMINPGHGGWTSGCRNFATINHALSDTTGFWESNTDLWKCQALRDDLISTGGKTYGIPSGKKLYYTGSSESSGGTVYMTRTINGIEDNVAYVDDDGQLQLTWLSVIAGYADYYEADYFISVHSNGTTDGSTTNYPLLLFRGYTDGTGATENSLAICNAAVDYVANNDITYKSSSTVYVRGDISFMGDYDTTGNYILYNTGSSTESGATRYQVTSTKYTGYYGVLKHGRDGYIAEGCFHSYHPERHRLLNNDYCRQEGMRYARAIRSYFSGPTETTGDIMGTVKNKDASLSHTYYTYKSGSIDAYYPLNEVYVYLHDSEGNYVAKYKTDDEYNGVYVFNGLAPGKYILNFTQISGYEDFLAEITVTANTTVFTNVRLSATSGSSECDEDATEYTSSITLTYEDGTTTPVEGDDEEDDGDDDEDDTATSSTRRIYAYDLTATASTTDDDAYDLSFTTNCTPTEFIISLYPYDSAAEDYATTASVTISSSDLTVDEDYTVSGNTYTVPLNADMAGSASKFRWSVTAKADAIESVTAVSSAVTFYAPYGVAVDNNPDTEYFGTVYVANNYPSGTSGYTYGNGIFRLDPQENVISSTAFALSSSTYTASSASHGLRALAVASDGRVFAAYYGSAEGVALCIDPSTGSETVTLSQQYLTSVGLRGTGSSTELFTLDFYSDDYLAVNDYAIGTASSYSGEATYTYNLSGIGTSRFSNIAPISGGFFVGYGKGGNSTASTPTGLYYWADGASGAEETQVYYSSSEIDNGALAINTEENMLAFSSGGAIKYGTYDDDNPASITFSSFSTSGTLGSYASAYAFDYAGNLYATSAEGHRLMVYAMPTEDNSKTTWATSAGTAGEGYVLDFSSATVDNSISKKVTKSDRRIYAYDLTATKSDDTYTLSFKTNTEANEFAVNFYLYDYEAGDYSETAYTTLSYSTADDYMSDGVYSVQVTADDLGLARKFRWSITVTADPISSFGQASTDEGQLFFYSPYGVAVDNDPASPYFGTAYVANSAAGVPTYTSRGTTSTVAGIYRLDPTDAAISSDKWDGVTWAGAAAGESPRRLAVTSDGRLFASDFGTTNPGIVYIDPSTGAGTRWFSSATNTDGSLDSGETHYGGMTAGLGVYCSDSDACVYAIDGSSTYGSTYYTINYYSLGSETVIDAEPDEEYQPTTGVSVTDANIVPVDGGYWISQSTDSGAQALLYYNVEGDDAEYVYTGSYATALGALAVYEEENLVAHSYRDADGYAAVRLATYSNESGTMTTTDYGIYSLYTQGTGSSAYAFDYAGNLYAVSPDGSTDDLYGQCLTVYAIPTDDNSCTTWATSTGTAGSAYVLDFSSSTLSDDTNYSQNYSDASRRIFAYDLKAELYGDASGSNATSGTYQFSFKTNIEAEEFSIKLYEYDEEEGTYDADSPSSIFRITESADEATIGKYYLADDTYYTLLSINEIGAGVVYRWSVTPVAGPVSELTESSSTDDKFFFPAPYGVACDIYPDSKYFGTVYVTNTYTGTPSSSNTTFSSSASRTQGIFRFDPQDTALDDASTPWESDVTWDTGSYAEAPRRIVVASDGRVFASDEGDSYPGVVYIDPSTGKGSRWFSSATNNSGSLDSGETHYGGMTAGLGIIGDGESTKIYTIDESLTYSGSYSAYLSIYRYDIGEGTVWDAAPSATFQPSTSGIGNINSNIAPVTGGFWACQYRSGSQSSEALPILFHYNENTGEVDYNLYSSSSSSARGALAVNEDAGLLAYVRMGSDETTTSVRLVSYSTDDNGNVSIEEDATYGLTSQSTLSNAYAFDYAGNLYAVSSADAAERLTIYAIPTSDNSTTTVASASVYGTSSAYIGFSTSSLTSGVESPGSDALSVSIYPNPATDEVTISSNGAMDAVAVYSLSGGLVAKVDADGQSSVTIDVSGLAGGIYVVRIDGTAHKLIIK